VTLHSPFGVSASSFIPFISAVQRERRFEKDTAEGGGYSHHLLGPKLVSTLASFSHPYPRSWHPYPPESGCPEEARSQPQGLLGKELDSCWARRDLQGHFIHFPLPRLQWDKSNANRWESSIREGDLTDSWHRPSMFGVHGLSPVREN